jgi:hypothetical protein
MRHKIALPMGKRYRLVASEGDSEFAKADDDDYDGRASRDDKNDLLFGSPGATIGPIREPQT